MGINREEFEAFMRDNYEWADDAINCAQFIGDDDAGHYVGGNYQFHGNSCSEALFWSWRGWQGRSKE